MQLWIYICTCFYGFIYAFLYAFMHLFMHMHIYALICIHSNYLCIYEYARLFMHLFIHVCLCIHSNYLCICEFMHVYLCIYLCTCVYAVIYLDSLQLFMQLWIYLCIQSFYLVVYSKYILYIHTIYLNKSFSVWFVCVFSTELFTVYSGIAI